MSLTNPACVLVIKYYNVCCVMVITFLTFLCSIYEKLIQMCEIEEFGSNYSKVSQ